MNRILVIDDDEDIATLLRRFLSKNGYEVETASSGTDGEKLVEIVKPDLILCDYQLGDMDAATLLPRIKEKNPDVPVLVITGYSDIKKV
jgi:two-component system response regulator HydG